MMPTTWKISWYACPINQFMYCSVDTTTGPVVVHSQISQSQLYNELMIRLMHRELFRKLKKEGRRPLCQPVADVS